MIQMNNDQFRVLASLLTAESTHSLRQTCRSVYAKPFLKLDPIPIPYLFGDHPQAKTLCAKSIKILIGCLFSGPYDPRGRRFEPPKKLFDRVKWLCGLENSLDREIYETYHECVEFILGCQPVNSLHLRNYLKIARRIGDEIEAYRIFKKSIEIPLVWRRFVFVISYLLQIFIPKAPLIDTDFLNPTGSIKKNYVKIGGFVGSDGRSYNICAFESAERFGRYIPFSEYVSNKTYIGIFHEDAERVIPYLQIGLRLKRSICIYKKKEDDRLSIRFEIICPFSIEKNEGDDRELDRKLVQILIEIFRYSNAEMIKGVVSSDDLILFAAAGIHAENSFITKPLIESLKIHRSKPSNKLFPLCKSYYSEYSVSMRRQDLDELKVYFTRSPNPKSWNQIFSESPILDPNCAAI